MLNAQVVEVNAVSFSDGLGVIVNAAPPEPTKKRVVTGHFDRPRASTAPLLLTRREPHSPIPSFFCSFTFMRRK